MVAREASHGESAGYPRVEPEAMTKSAKYPGLETRGYNGTKSACADSPPRRPSHRSVRVPAQG